MYRRNLSFQTGMPVRLADREDQALQQTLEAADQAQRESRYKREQSGIEKTWWSQTEKSVNYLTP